jgi:hypothetical protein
MYRMDDRRRRQLLEDALVAFLLEGSLTAPKASKPVATPMETATPEAAFIDEPS